MTFTITQDSIPAAFQASFSWSFFPKCMHSLAKPLHILPGIPIYLCWIHVHFSNGVFSWALVMWVQAEEPVGATPLCNSGSRSGLWEDNSRPKKKAF